jgi:transcriptional regulator with XRE-family HTH domain
MAQTRRNDMAFAEDLISQFRMAREHSGLTQEQVDGRLGIADGLTAKWENSFRKPTLFHAYCWAEALDQKIVLSPSKKDENDL